MIQLHLYIIISLEGDKVSVLTHTFPNEHLRKIKLVICKHQAD